MSKHAMVVGAICLTCVAFTFIVGAIILVFEGHKDD